MNELDLNELRREDEAEREINPDSAKAQDIERNRFTGLRRQLSVQQRYIEELENQLEPNVIAEIRAELEAQEESQ